MTGGHRHELACRGLRAVGQGQAAEQFRLQPAAIAEIDHRLHGQPDAVAGQRLLQGTAPGAGAHRGGGVFAVHHQLHRLPVCAGHNQGQIGIPQQGANGRCLTIEEDCPGVTAQRGWVTPRQNAAHLFDQMRGLLELLESGAKDGRVPRDVAAPRAMP